MKLVHLITIRLREALRDPVGERLDRERRRDAVMFRRRGAYLPWAP